MKDLIIEQLDKLTDEQLLDLISLIDSCCGYEPFYSQYNAQNDNIIQFAAFIKSPLDSKKRLVGFISCLPAQISAENDYSDTHLTIASDIATHNIYEVTALVSPALRQQGIFKKMFLKLKKQLIKGSIFIAAVNTESVSNLKHSSFKLRFAYSEYLMEYSHTTFDKCSSEHDPSCRKDNALYAPDSSCHNDSTLYEFYFSDDDKYYLMYQNDGDEPIAVCQLDYQPSFTNISGVFVDEPLRNQKIGTIFIKKLIEDYFNDFKNRLILNVQSTNIAAVKLYKKCGFTITEHIDYYFVESDFLSDSHIDSDIY